MCSIGVAFTFSESFYQADYYTFSYYVTLATIIRINIWEIPNVFNALHRLGAIERGDG